MQEPEEPPSREPSLVVIGRNGIGEWGVQECSGLFGGLFVSRAQAMKYALFENGHHRENIVLTDTIVELDTARRPAAQRPETSPSDAVRKHAA